MPVLRRLLILALSLSACSHAPLDPAKVVHTETGDVSLPPPGATKSARKFSKVKGWQPGETPRAEGFQVKAFARDLINPRNLYVGANGDVFVAEANTELSGVVKFGAKLIGYAGSERVGPSANRITVLRDQDHDGVPETRTVFLENLNQPFGMLILGDFFYVANTDGLWRYPYKSGDTRITQPGAKILELPAGGYNNHWTRNIIARLDGQKIFVSVGSGSNDAEHGLENEVRRANVLEINPDGSGERIYASGLRNPVGMAFAPGGDVLWTVVNERDGLGDDLVPDYLTGLKDGGFYGWPYAYFGPNRDPNVKDAPPDLVARTIVPDVPLGSHTASLGLAFNTGTMFPERYRGGAFIGQHGSWNRSEIVGYRVAFVPFQDGGPTGSQEPFLTGFVIDEKKREVHGRPVGLAFLQDGSLLVADDAGNTIWRVSR